MRIVRYVKISPDSVLLDGKVFPVSGCGKELLTGVYRALGVDYPKFFKMDMLCRLGFAASELLLDGEDGRFVPREDRAVLLFSRLGPFCNDVNFSRTIAPDAFFPSPALFVYTLANIVTGEIAIRNGYRGDTSAFEMPDFNAAQLLSAVNAAFLDPVISSAVCGWADCRTGSDFEAVMFLVDSGEGPLHWNENVIENIRKYGRTY